jgi:hypothetical protein
MGPIEPPLRRVGRRIGTLNEKPLHESLKRWCTQPGDRIEIPVDGFVVDIVRGDLLIEVQTRNFSAIRRKLERLLTHHRVRLVYPIPCEKWIARVDHCGVQVGRRRSPKRGAYEDVFEELVSIPELPRSPNFSLELLLIREEEVRRHDSSRCWRRRGWVTHERRLLDVVGQRTIENPADLSAFIPVPLAEPFAASDLAKSLNLPLRLARMMIYCLRKAGCIALAGKRGRAALYARPID